MHLCNEALARLVENLPWTLHVLRALRYLAAIGVIVAMIRLDTAVAALPQRTFRQPAGRFARWLAAAPGGTIAFAGFYLPVLFKSWAQGIAYNAIGVLLSCISVACAISLARQTCEFDALVNDGETILHARRRSWFRRPWLRPWLVFAIWLCVTAGEVYLLHLIRFRPLGVDWKDPLTLTDWVVWFAMAALPLAILLWIATVVSATRSLSRWRRA
jgi:hypothetical protein